MAFPDGWRYRIPLTVNSAYIDAALTDWTLLLPALPQHVRDNARSDGGDLRLSTGTDGTGQLGLDIRSYSGDDLATRVPSLSATVDTTVHLWYGKADETQPAANATGGQYAAYHSDYGAVYPLRGDAYDRTSNQRHATASSGASYPDGTYLALTGSNSYVALPNTVPRALPTTYTALVRCSSTTVTGSVISHYAYAATDSQRFRLANGTPSAFTQTGSSASTYGAGSATAGITANQWHHGAARWNTQSSRDALLDGGAKGSDTTNYGAVTLGDPHIGAIKSGANIVDSLAGHVREARLSSVSRSDAWIAAEAANLLNPAAFATWGTPVDLIGTGNRRRRLLLAGAY